MDRSSGSNLAKTTGRAIGQQPLELTAPLLTPLAQHCLQWSPGAELVAEHPAFRGASTVHVSDSWLPHCYPQAPSGRGPHAHHLSLGVEFHPRVPLADICCGSSTFTCKMRVSGPWQGLR